MLYVGILIATLLIWGTLILTILLIRQDHENYGKLGTEGHKNNPHRKRSDIKKKIDKRRNPRKRKNRRKKMSNNTLNVISRVIAKLSKRIRININL
jgi:hypothetical protein